MKYQARQKGYKVLGHARPDQVLPNTGPHAEAKHFFNHLVKMTSLRYQCFVKSTKCVCCGIKGTVMLLEMPSNGGKICMPHFNLYAEREGGLVQMTKDHKKPKSKGGEDHINNMQTLCCRCNELKGSRATKLKQLREIQDGIQTVYMVLYYDGIPMEGFATSNAGLAEIVRRFIIGSYQWQEDSFQVQARIKHGIVTVTNEIGEPCTFNIKPIRRV